MAVPVDAEESLAAKFAALFPHLDERQRRLVMGAEARVLGHGGIKVVAAAADVSAVTVSRGVAELEGGGEPLGRARRPGGGRKRAAGTDPGLKDALLALVDPESRGDPESPLRWTTKSTRHLAAALTAAGHPVSAPTVAALLKEESFSLQGNVKTLEGARHADRDAQFRYINAQARDHIDAGDPVISVDAKKKENVGPFKKGGAEWQPKGAPEPVNVHDFIDKELGKVTPYGVYDVAGNAGWVSVGTDHDTAAFAVATIRTWWDKAGQAAYPDARRLLITADGGGSNGYRTRLWKTELAAFAAETGLQITVCHLPPGTSKWNKIEHRLFSHISMNWRGRPLTSHEVIVNTIAATTTRTGLTVSAELDTGDYPKGIKISDREIQNLEKQNVLRHHDFHGEWNYCLDPPPPPPETSVLFICGRLLRFPRGTEDRARAPAGLLADLGVAVAGGGGVPECVKFGLLGVPGEQSACLGPVDPCGTRLRDRSQQLVQPDVMRCGIHGIGRAGYRVANLGERCAQISLVGCPPPAVECRVQRREAPGVRRGPLHEISHGRILVGRLGQPGVDLVVPRPGRAGVEPDAPLHRRGLDALSEALAESGQLVIGDTVRQGNELPALCVDRHETVP